MDKSEVIEIVRRFKELIKDYFKLEKVYLYGSYARDTYTKDSDIDVAVIVEKIEGDFFETTPVLWKLRRQIDDRIEPILLESGNDHSGFISEIQSYGIEII